VLPRVASFLIVNNRLIVAIASDLNITIGTRGRAAFDTSRGRSDRLDSSRYCHRAVAVHRWSRTCKQSSRLDVRHSFRWRSRLALCCHSRDCRRRVVLIPPDHWMIKELIGAVPRWVAVACVMPDVLPATAVHEYVQLNPGCIVVASRIGPNAVDS
jgi:hypothetical protein